MFDYLQLGVIVKDRAGLRKRITRLEGGKVFWIYADRSDKRQHSSDYERFIDTHFLVPELALQEAEAA